MVCNSLVPCLLGEAVSLSSGWLRFLVGAAIILSVIVLPFFLGKYLAKLLRMPDYWWKIGLILCALASATVVTLNGFPPKLGVDLKGGVILIYEVEQAGGEQPPGEPPTAGGEPFDMDGLVQALARRINPSGTKEIAVRPYGASQVEIIVPEADPIEIAQIKRIISTAGALEFRIVANEEDHGNIIELARAMARDRARKRSREVRDDQRRQVGSWATVAREQTPAGGAQPFKTDVSSDVIRNAKTGNIIRFNERAAEGEEGVEVVDRSGDESLESCLARAGIDDIEVLMWTPTDEIFDVRGDNLGAVSGSFDNTMMPCVDFSMAGVGVHRFRALTTTYSPDAQTGFHRRLGIVMDGQLLSAPRILTTISDRGQITGQFTQEEVDFLVGVLRAGKLPASLNKTPISESQIGSMLGDDMIVQGAWSVGISLVCVFVFMLYYYRLSGVNACLVLLANLLLTVAAMIVINATLTMPGLAGLVLTVGMSVDANVLIFERMREELGRGASLRMTIRNGFDRAMSAIVDANLTTIISAVVLYAIGTDQLRGFAVTLILGIVTSMFTAIFCSHVIFDIAERSRWISTLKMRSIIGATNINFVALARPATILSLVVITAGLVAIGVRGANILDIDFMGGTSVHVLLKDPMPVAEVRRRLDAKLGTMTTARGKVEYTLNSMNVATVSEPLLERYDKNKDGSVDRDEWRGMGSDPSAPSDPAAADRNGDGRLTPLELSRNRVYKVDASLDNVDDLKNALADVFRDGDRNLLAMYAMDWAKLDFEPIREAGGSKAPPAGAPPASKPEAGAPPAGKPEAGAPPAAKPAAVPSPAKKAVQAPPSGGEKTSTPTSPGQKAPAAEQPPASAPAKQGAADDAAQDTGLKRRHDLPPDTWLASGDLSPVLLADVLGVAPQVASSGGEKAASGAAAAGDKAPPVSKQQPAAAAGPASDGKSEDLVRCTTELTFAYTINASTLQGEFEDSAKKLDVPVPQVEVSNSQWDGRSNKGYGRWTVKFESTEADARAILRQMKDRFSGWTVWPSSNVIGPRVAGDAQNLAIAALIASNLGIIAYVWLRFERLVFGVAAVVALIHDVLITLAAIAFSYWLAKAGFGFLLIQEERISLTIVAALLTIIGYSMNDTIVIFDRIREIRGRSPELTVNVVNLALNQTLSRTVLTAFTVFMVLIILYIFGGQAIHGFAYAMLVGVIAGSYSTLFIATPLVLWILGAGKKTAKQRS